MLISNEAPSSIDHRRSERDTSIREGRSLRERAWAAGTINLLMRQAAEPTRLQSRQLNEAESSSARRHSERDTSIRERQDHPCVSAPRSRARSTCSCARRAEPTRLRSRRRIADRAVVSACAAPLGEMATALRDASAIVNARTLRLSIRRFLGDTASSPLFANHPTAARFTAEALCQEIASGSADKA